MSFWSRPDILLNYRTEVDSDKLCSLREAKRRVIRSSNWSDVVGLLDGLASRVEAYEFSSHSQISFANGEVKVGLPEWLTSEDHKVLDNLIRRLVPWRKGPFNLCGHLIDSEWRSDLKWDRVLPHLAECRGMKILDVGASTGYYMYRLLELDPEVVVGLDPSERCFFNFELVQLFVRDPRLVFEVLRSDELSVFNGFFDVTLCMGVVYHVRDPLTLLRQVRDSLRPGGLVVLESQVIDREGPYALFPRGRYTKSHNMYFIPTPECLIAWMEKSGFVDCKLVSVEKVTPFEQRKTEFAPYESLEDFLDPMDSNRTVEGYPAPLRAVVTARKKL